MQMHPNKDTQLCMSLSARPGNFGLRFHNHLYEQLGLNFYYKAFSSQDLPGAIGGIRALGVRGCGVSMPFKEAAIALMDELDDSVQAIDSLNTIVNTNGHLKAYNTDYIAIEQLLKKHAVPKDSSFALRGSGGMANAEGPDVLHIQIGSRHDAFVPDQGQKPPVGGLHGGGPFGEIRGRRGGARARRSAPRSGRGCWRSAHR